MQINNNISSSSFTARSAEIRLADDVIRHAMNQFPAISTSKIVNFAGVKKFYCFKYWLQCKSLQLELMRNRFINLKSMSRAKKIMSEVRSSRSANCGEQAHIAHSALLANGFKNVNIVSLASSTKKAANAGGDVCNISEKLCDHTFVVVNLDKNAILSQPKTYGKKAFIVDPWMGFTDYVSSAFSRYESKYMKNPKTFLGKDGCVYKTNFILRAFDEIQTANNRDLRIYQQEFPFLKLDKSCKTK